MNKTIKIGNIDISNDKPFVLIAGPCSIESEEMVMRIAKDIKEITTRLEIPFIFKSSFDKANRTSADGYRGVGIENGLKILGRVKEELNIPIITDIHLPDQAEKVAKVVDILQIPAFLCRQTDLIEAAAKTGKVVNVKKAQFLAAWDMNNVVNKMEKCGNKNILLCERGTSFGYNNLVVDMTSLIEMSKTGYPVVFDATHSVQKPGGKGNSTGGNREYVKYLSRAAMAIGVGALFLEVHPDPDNALSDGPNMVRLDQLEEILIELKTIDKIIKK
ncbi:3-deoxy-8-phosphooctulonate synthase [Clostridium paraputrificum]|uniref:3-deoxy-8-phosphooctulonate synthase n=1 Tax=Clostridium paraputrificum TaxID=29363 RepID=UPI003D34D3C1